MIHDPVSDSVPETSFEKSYFLAQYPSIINHLLLTYRHVSCPALAGNTWSRGRDSSIQCDCVDISRLSRRDKLFELGILIRKQEFKANIRSSWVSK